MNYTQSLNIRNLNPVIVIIAINVVVFIAVNITYQFGSDKLLDFLALYSRPFFSQRPWGLITSVFTHYGLFHLLANMFTLYFFGNFLLRITGVRDFILLYLAGGLAGSIFFVLMAPAYHSAVGASGAVFALGGALAVLVPRTKVFVFPIPAPLPLWVAVIGGFIILSFLTGVAWQAHLGGLLAGLAGGLIFKRRQRRYYF